MQTIRIFTGDHFVVELADGGRLRVGADDGGGARSVFSRSPSLADGMWHNVEVFQTGSRSFTVRVDGQYTDVLNLIASRNTLDLTGDLYIGGVPASVRARLPSNVLSKSNGFSGCMASTVINGRLFDLMNEARLVSSSVTPGCTSEFSTSPSSSSLFLSLSFEFVYVLAFIIEAQLEYKFCGIKKN